MNRRTHWIVCLSLCLVLPFACVQAQHFNWAREMKGNVIEPKDVDVDLFGNSAVCGSYRDSVNLQPGYDSTVIGAGFNNGFVARYDAQGRPSWWHRIGQDCRAAAMGPFGSVYVIGDFVGTFDFDPGTGTYELTSSGSGWNRYVCKLDSAQGLEWVFQVPFGVDEIETDALGNVYVAGSFEGTEDFNPLGTPLTAGVGTNGLVAFVAKYTASGICQWVSHCLTTTNTLSQGNWMYVHDLFVSDEGRPYIGGSFTGEFQDPTTNEIYVSKEDGYDMFYSALDVSGDFRFTNVHGSKNHDQVDGITETPDGGIAITGFGQGNVKFAPANTGTTMHNRASQECFMVKLDSLGNFEWLRATISKSNSNGVEVMTSGDDELWLVCGSNDSAAYISTNDTFFFNENSGLNLFIVRYTLEGDIIDVEALMDDAQFKNPKAARLWNAKLWLVGMYEGLIDLNFGTNSRWMEEQTFVHGFVSNYQVCRDDDFLMSSLDTNICDGDSVEFMGAVYTSSGTYSNRVLLPDGCDSIDRLQLEVAPTYYVEKDTLICPSEPFTYLGQSIDQSGAFHFPDTSQWGCDSSFTLNAMFNDVQIGFSSGTHYLSSGWSGGTYQWYECLSGAYIEIPAADSQSYEPTQNGSFAVVSQVGACIDTSDCFEFEVSGLEVIVESDLNIYPNPTTGLVFIESNLIVRSYHLYDLSGRLLDQKSISSSSLRIEVPNGLYILNLQDQKGKHHPKLLEVIDY